MVALNASRQAEGEFYLDDGKSYEYKTGAFLLRRFLFAEGRLQSVDASGGRGVFSTPCVVERVVVMGAAAKEGRGAAVDGGKEVLEVRRLGGAWGGLRSLKFAWLKWWVLKLGQIYL